MYYPVSSILIEFLVLAIVEKQDSYGYEISQTIKIVADIKESTLYPILKNWKRLAMSPPIPKNFKGESENIIPLLLLDVSISPSCRVNGIATKTILMEL